MSEESQRVTVCEGVYVLSGRILDGEEDEGGGDNGSREDMDCMNYFCLHCCCGRMTLIRL